VAVFLGRRPAAGGEDISAEQLAQDLAGGSPPVVLDVRGADEFAAGHIPGAQLLPLPELGWRLAEIPAGRPVVCVCLVGQRSARAAELLRAKGMPARSLTGGMRAWKGAVARGRG